MSRRRGFTKWRPIFQGDWRAGVWAVGLTITICCGTIRAGSAEGQAESEAEVQQLYREAQAARERGDLKLAEQKYLEVIGRAPQLANAYHNLGIVYFMQRRYHDSVAVLEKAAGMDPHGAAVYVMLGLAHYELYQPEKAIAALRTALRLNPTDGNALLYLGKSLVQRKDYRAAARTLEKLAPSKPHDPEVLYNLSLAYMKLMLESLNRLGEVSPHSYQVSLLLGQDAEARGNDDTAIQHYQEAIRAKPEAVGAHYALGSALARLGRYDEAAKEFRKELGVNGNDSLALWKLGEISLLSDPQKARLYLERAVNLNPELPQVVLAYGRALARLGETKKAVEQFVRVVQLAPEEDSVHYLLAKAYRQLGRERERELELARFEELAKKKSERRMEMARQLIELTRAAQEQKEDPEPGFEPSREPLPH